MMDTEVVERNQSSLFNINYNTPNIPQRANLSETIRTVTDRHTLPELPRTHISATVSHVISKEIGENYSKTSIRPETVKKLFVSGNVADDSHRTYVQNLREIQARRELQLQKIAQDEKNFILANALAKEQSLITTSPKEIGAEKDKPCLSSLYVDENALTRDQVILPRDFLSQNLQRQAKPLLRSDSIDTPKESKDTTLVQENITQPVVGAKRAGEKLPRINQKTYWKEQLRVPDRDFDRTKLQAFDKLTNYHVNPRYDENKQGQLITNLPPMTKATILPVFEAIPSEVLFTRYRVGDVHETTLQLRNLSSVAHSCRVIPPKTPYFCMSLGEFPAGQSIVATGLSVTYNIKFAPDTLGSYEDEIIVQCSNGTEFPVKLYAKRPPPLLTLPAMVDCGHWLVGGRKVCQFKVRNDGGEGRFALVPASLWPSVSFKSIVRNEMIQIPPFEIAPSTLELRSGDTFTLQVSFAPQIPGEFLEEFVMVCDNGEITRHKLRGISQTIQIQLEEIEGGGTDIDELEFRDISAQYSIRFIPINPFSYCQKKLTIKNATHVELPFSWTLLKPVLYNANDFSNQPQSIEIERVINDTSPFHIEPPRGTLAPNSTSEFRLIFAPSQIGDYHTVMHLIIPNAPIYPLPSQTQTSSSSLTSIGPIERANSPDLISSSGTKSDRLKLSSGNVNRVSDMTVLRLETRGVCESFKYIFEPYAICFMDKLFKGLAYRKDFQLTNTSISPLMVSWAHLLGPQIVHVEPVVAEIPSDATGLFTLIMTGTEIGPTKLDFPFKLDGIDDYGYLHIEAEICGPDVEIEPTTIDFGLVEYGRNVEKFVSVKNMSPILAKCKIREVNPTSLISFGSDEFILKPIELYPLSVRLAANEEGILLSVVHLNVEDGKTIPIEVTSLIQRPSAYLTPVEVNIESAYIGIPIVQFIKLYAVNTLPTKFQWGQPIGNDIDQCEISIIPSSGIIQNGESFVIEVTFLAKNEGNINDLHIPCYIQNSSAPIFLKLKVNMKGMNVMLKKEENEFKLDDLLTLDFDDVQLGKQSTMELTITNLTDIKSKVRPNISKFKAKVIPTNAMTMYKKPQGLEPSDQSIGVGFYTGDTVYKLYPKSSITLPITVVSSMWGTYNDTLQLQIDGIDLIKEIPIRVNIVGTPIRMYLSAANDDTLPVVQFGTMLHNANPLMKKIHLQNISHNPVRIDWILYDRDNLEVNPTEKQKVIQLIPVIGHPFDSLNNGNSEPSESNTYITEGTLSTIEQSDRTASDTERSVTTTTTDRLKPLKLYMKPYEGAQCIGKNCMYTISPTTKVIPPREHIYLDLTFTPSNCPIQNRTMQCNATSIGILSVSQELQGSSKHGYERVVFYEHEQVQFEMHAILEMPMLRVEVNDDDDIDEKTEDRNETPSIHFAIPVGDLVLSRPSLYDCTIPSSGDSTKRVEKIYKRSINLLNYLQCNIPFDIDVSDSSYLSTDLTTTKTLSPNEKCLVRCNFHLTQDLIDRYINYDENSIINGAEYSVNNEHGRRLKYSEQLVIKYKNVIENNEQIIPINIRLYYPLFLINYDLIDFQICFLNQTRQKELVLKNPTCSSSAWSIRKIWANIPDAFESFQIEPKSGILKTNFKDKTKRSQQIIQIYFTAKQTHYYECKILVEGLLGEKPLHVTLKGQGSFDGKYEAILDI